MSNREAFLEATKAARDARKAEKAKEVAAVTLQSATRGWLSRLRIKRELREKVDQFTENSDGNKKDQTATEMYQITRGFLLLNAGPKDLKDKAANIDRLEGICKRLTDSLESENPKYSYVGLAFTSSKDSAVDTLAWISHIKSFLTLVVEQLDPKISGLRPNTNRGSKATTTFLRTLLTFTNAGAWKVLKVKSLARLMPGMQQLCANILGHLVNSGMMQRLKSFLLAGLAGPGGPVLKKTTVAAVLTLASRPVIAAKYSDKLVSLFLLHILSVPALIKHLQRLTPGETIDGLLLNQDHDLAWRVFRLLAKDDQQLKIHFNALEGSYALCLTANLIHIVAIYAAKGTAVSYIESDVNDSVLVITRMLESCGQYVTAKQSNLSHWHPVLGWFSVSIDSYLQDSMTLVRDQLSELWSAPCVGLYFKPLIALVDKMPEAAKPPSPVFSTQQLSPDEEPPMNAAKQFFKKAMEKTKSTTSAVMAHSKSESSAPTSLSSSSGLRIGSPPVLRVALVCTMYQAALKTLSQLKLEILAGLCRQDVLLPPLWKFMQGLGPHCGLKSFLDNLSVNPKATAPEFQLLTLFADCLSYLLAILDDVEMYEKNVPFALGHYITISHFLNVFLFRGVWHNLIVDTKCPLFVSLHGLLMVLYRRDSRRPFTKSNHWLLPKEIKASTLIGEFDKGKKNAAVIIQKLPHVISHADRVVIFRRKISADKTGLGISNDSLENVHVGISTLVTIHRSRLVEDGYRQLSTLSSASLKGVIRVKFVNVQGLDEAGIDQDGVFKEFLEETIKKVFDPGLNLFCATSDERLYPSPLSHLTDNHLALFEFVGKMIGKAVYEGIVVDVPFATFFISQVLGQDQSTAYYSYVDELSSLDAELYKNLTYVKYYEGDAADLGLTFSVDQDVMGQIVTHELIHGGKGVAVTDDNKISYMHAVAQFRMHTQIREQTAAFTRGFRAIIAPEWLHLFSPPEVVRLIAGDNNPLDLKDLRKHTHYYGGFHDAHRVINWLWEILEKDFSPKERCLFLRFVTSCSKPPLLGFQHLEPTFSIRCVEVGEDEDDGDTVGSVLRGFLALRKRDPVNRLPTASTCFNLLKLPNYQKKSTLREKLRYAVTSNTGFELS